MILSPAEDLIVSSIGWTDQSALRVLETKTGRMEEFVVSEAKYLSVYPGRGGHFSVLHHYEGARIEITVHSFSDPAKALARIVFSAQGVAFDGSPPLWEAVPHAYVAYFVRPSWADFHLFLINPSRSQAEVLSLDWYDDTYDKGYQGICEVAQVPGRPEMLFSVQRDSNLVRFDVESRKVVDKIPLADRGGNPRLRFLSTKHELWATDYDTLVRLTPGTWRVENSLLLQAAGHGMMRLFAGEFAFTPDETLCVVARPFSGDVVAIDTKSFKVTHACNLGRQPLAVTILSDGSVFARDWKTGDLLQGVLKRKWF